MGDGAVRVFINTKGRNREDFSQEFLDLMEYITETTDAAADRSGSGRIKLIQENVRRVKLSEKMGGKYMQRWEEMAYARLDGKAEGEEIKLIKQICRKLIKNKTPEEIGEDLEEDIEVIRKICDIAKEFAPEYDSEKIYEKYNSALI